MIRTSIVVTSGNRDDVTASVASALDQTAPDVEVVVVGTAEPDAVLSGDPRVRQLACEAPGFAAQVNAALATVRAPLIKLLPAGDRLAPQSVAAQAAALAARPDVGVVFSLVECVDGAGRLVAAEGAYATAARTRDELLPALLGALEIAIASALVRREVLVDQGGLDPLYTTRAVAHDLWLRALPRCDGVLLADRLARVRASGGGDRVACAERGLAQLRALDREGAERFLAALGGGPDASDEARAAARLALADALLASGQATLLPSVHRLIAEARELGSAVGSGRAARLAAVGLSGLSLGPSGRGRGSSALALAATDPQPLEARSILVSRSRSSSHNSAALFAAAFVAPPRNMLDIPSSSRLGSDENPSQIYATNFGSGTLAPALRERRRRLARSRAVLAAEHDAGTALAELGREMSRKLMRTFPHEARAPIDPHPLARIGSRIALLSDEILERLRIGKRLRHAAGRVLGGMPATSRPAEPPRRGGDPA